MQVDQPSASAPAGPTLRPAARNPAEAALTPLVVDLDGTLIATDVLVESVVRLLKHSPLNFVRLLAWLLQGRAALKAKVAAQVAIAEELLPFNAPLLAYLSAQKALGRRIVLATAAHESVAHGVARHLDLFDDVIASDARTNLKGHAKLAAIRDRVGPSFIYAGDSRADVPIWRASEQAVLVGVSVTLGKVVRADVPIAETFSRRAAGPGVWVRALRMHQWTKNTLLAVPLLTSFSFTDPGNLVRVAVAFLAFSLAASATYILNDLWDLDDDRAHPRKRLRPFASGHLSIVQGCTAAVLALLAAALLALALSPAFLGMLASYVLVTTAYSLVLKGYVLIDVVTLSLLYTYRIVTGGVAIGVGTSAWLLAFSILLFLGLALVKRCSELVRLREAGRDQAPGRDYRVSDLVVLWPLGIGAGLCAVVVFALFITAAGTQERYASPQLLWLLPVGLISWTGRLWIKTARGEMHDDPLVFALRDRGCCVIASAMVLVMVAARFVPLSVPLSLP